MGSVERGVGEILGNGMLEELVVVVKHLTLERVSIVIGQSRPGSSYEMMNKYLSVQKYGSNLSVWMMLIGGVGKTEKAI